MLFKILEEKNFILWALWIRFIYSNEFIIYFFSKLYRNRKNLIYLWLLRSSGKRARSFAQLKIKSEARCIIMLRFLNGSKIEIPQLVKFPYILIWININMNNFLTISLNLWPSFRKLNRIISKRLELTVFKLIVKNWAVW